MEQLSSSTSRNYTPSRKPESDLSLSYTSTYSTDLKSAITERNLSYYYAGEHKESEKENKTKNNIKKNQKSEDLNKQRESYQNENQFLQRLQKKKFCSGGVAKMKNFHTSHL